MPKPVAPERPELSAQGPARFRIAWEIPEVDPEITACTLKVRIQGSQRWQNYDHATGRLVPKGGATVPAPACEVLADGFEDGLAYEAIVAAMNQDGWSEVSSPSEPATIGEPRLREKPLAPDPPRLITTGPGRLRCSWSIPQTCPPVEASQVQLTDVAAGSMILVDAANGKLVESGRTTFAAPRCESNVVGVRDGTEYVASVCCRNAEGFGEYSLPSDPAVAGADPRAQSNGMELVLHKGPTSETPVLEPLGEGRMRVRWTLPEEARATTVKLRRVGDNNWRLIGGSAIEAPTSEMVANGLEEGLEYEAMVAHLIGGRWCGDSPVSRPACIGELRLPGLPGAAREPRLFVLDLGDGCRMRVKWHTPVSVPPVTGVLVKFRELGSRVWRFIRPTGEIVDDDLDYFSPAANEVDVAGLRPGVRYECCLTLRNRLGMGPDSLASESACIGRPTPRLQKCMYCYADFDLQHVEFTKSRDTFWCLPCRFRNMDPFNAVVEPHGLLASRIVNRSVMSFNLDLPDLKAWRREEHAVQMRMVRVNSDNCAQVWPKSLAATVNGNEAVVVKEPEEGHVRRDVPKAITAELRTGANHVVVTMTDDHIQGFGIGIVRTYPRTVQHIAKDIPVCGEEAAMSRVSALLAETWTVGMTENDDDEAEVSCVISNKLKLRCPLSFERVCIPVRGESCQHLQCFGLGAYLESNVKMRSLNNRWTCPACGNILRPRDLRVDGYVERVLAETSEDVEEVLILSDGSYRVIEESTQRVRLLDRQASKNLAAVGRQLGEKLTAAEPDSEAIADDVARVHEVVDGDAARGRRRRKEDAVAGMPGIEATEDDAWLAKRQRRRERLLNIPGDDSSDSGR